MTVWELKKLVSLRLKISPRQFELKRSDLKKPAFDELSHAKLLRDMRLESYEII